MIIGGEITLREFDIEKDIRKFYSVHSKPDVIKYYGMNPLKSVEKSVSLMSNYIESTKNQKSMHWVICDTTNQEYMGDIGLFNINFQHKRANSYCILSPEYWGKKISKKATFLLFPFLFSNTSLNRIQAFVDTRNHPAIKSLKDIGYLYEGVLYEYEFENDEFIDISVFAITRNQFEQIHKQYP
jgi:ribosomal-protein-alanine N-acetyltransferase